MEITELDGRLIVSLIQYAVQAGAIRSEKDFLDLVALKTRILETYTKQEK